MGTSQAVEFDIHLVSEGAPPTKTPGQYRQAVQLVAQDGRERYALCSDRKHARAVYNGLKRAAMHHPGVRLSMSTNDDGTVSIFIRPPTDN